MTTANTKILDLDTLVPEQRIVVLQGRRFDTSTIPLGLAFKVMDVKSGLTSEDEGESLQAVMGVLAAILGKDEQGEPVTGDWLMENLNVDQVGKLVAFIEDLFQFGPDADGSLDPTKGQAASTPEDLSSSENSSPRSATSTDGPLTTSSGA